MRRPLQRLALGAIALSLGACGQTPTPAPPAVRIGSRTITQTELGHWTEIMEREHHSSRSASREQALSFLIDSIWLVEEAREEGVLSNVQVARQLSAHEHQYQGGADEMRAFLALSGRTTADLKLELEAQQSAASIRGALLGRMPEPSRGQIAAYYSAHEASFRSPERRYYDIINPTSDARARSLRRAIEAGASVAPIALHEERSDPPGPKDALERAIFAEKLGVLTGPILLKGEFHSLFEVKRIVPAERRGLAQVQPLIRRRLLAAQQQRTLKRFLAAWTVRWKAKTDCEPGYVVHQCKQYSGPQTAPEEVLG